MSRSAARPPQRPEAGAAGRSPANAAPVPATSPASPFILVLAALVPALAAVFAYVPALRHGFIWDDPLVLDQLRAIHSVGDIFALPPAIPKLYYRPVIFITYLADQWVGGASPYWFHLSVIAFHVINTLLVFGLVRHLLPEDWRVASGSALLFAVFPTHVESVAWMAGRSDVIVCTFLLLSVLLFSQRQLRWTSWVGGLAFLLALLSKEMALAGLVLIPLLDLLSARRLLWTRYPSLLIASVTYVVLRQHATGVLIGGTPTGSPVHGLVADLLGALGFYVRQALLPFQLSAYVPEVPAGAGYAVLGVAAMLGSVGFVAIAWRRQWALVFLLAWFWLTLAPSLTVIVRRSASAAVADRYLYVPTVASCILLVCALSWIMRRGGLPPHWRDASVVILSVTYLARLMSYTPVWADNFTFWTDVARKAPAYTLPHRELASALVERNRLPEAEQALQSALRGKSEPEGMAMTYNNLGNLYRRLERYDDAQEAFQKGLQIAPHPMLYHNLGMALMKRIEVENHRGDQVAVMRDMAQARTAFETAIRMAAAPGAPEDFQEWNPAKSHALLGQILVSTGHRDEAREHLEASLQLEPTGPAADATRQYMKRLE